METESVAILFESHRTKENPENQNTQNGGLPRKVMNLACMSE